MSLWDDFKTRTFRVAVVMTAHTLDDDATSFVRYSKSAISQNDS
ncbi:hypothetical protein [Paenarthrobacter aromaticivorans]|nr:hypothetical protein [Paenarthrobacter sp. MMS21-TAE1-1]